MPSSVTRWVFTDLKTSETATVMYNPDAMTSPYPKRKFIYNSTTAGPDGGVAVTYEMPADPVEWQFSGQILKRAHFDMLIYWSRKKNRITITDHYQRVLTVLLQEMAPIPKRAIGYYWRHTYTVNAVVYKIVDAPSGVGD